MLKAYAGILLEVVVVVAGDFLSAFGSILAESIIVKSECLRVCFEAR